MNAADGQALLYRRLVGTGSLPAEWRSSYWAAARHRFIPDRIWVNRSGRVEPLERTADIDAWMAASYADAPVVTQLNDGDEADERRYVTSSASAPSIVFDMLTHAGVHAGQRVVEIGTGTGWNAALLAARLGAGHVVTVEVDADLAARARAALHAAGFSPTVVTGDGTAGCAAGAPYDRVISTAAVRRVPYAWVEQTRPHGVIVTPWGTAFDNGALLRLVVDDDGTTAAGHFVDDDIAFMWVRDQRWTFGTLDDHIGTDDDADQGTTTVFPGDYLSRRASFAVGLSVSDIQRLTVWHEADDPDDEGCEPGGGCRYGDDHRYTVYLLHPDSGSWASVTVTYSAERADKYPVAQHGPRHLADEVEAAYAGWQAAGCPSFDRYTVTIDPEGQHIESRPRT